MGLLETFLIGVGLAADAFAVAVCKGLGMRRINWGQAFVIAMFFGGFQALMPLVGWALGTQFASLIEPVDHWIAFGLLAFIGGKMLKDAFAGEAECDGSCEVRDSSLDYRELTMMAVATSIDALAVGVSFAFLGVSIWLAVAVIGVTTFVISFAGVVIGNQFGSRFEKPATIAGGVILILIGVKILVEGLLG